MVFLTNLRAGAAVGVGSVSRSTELFGVEVAEVEVEVVMAVLYYYLIY